MWIRYVTGQVVSFFFTLFRLIPLRWNNRFSRSRIPAWKEHDRSEVLISLTTHGHRLRTVFLAIESVMRGSHRVPIVLWLDPEDYDRREAWPLSLKRLVRRGLTVRRGDGGLGPHAKYWNQFRVVAGSDTRVITIDDDVIYPEWFVDRLLTIGNLRLDAVVAYRAHRIELREGRLLPYMKWSPADTSEASLLHFATGVSGVCYPPAFIEYVVAQGMRFREVAPRADDVWLHVCALRSGHPVRQVFANPRNFAVIPSAQLSALIVSNGMGGGNDDQIERAYTPQDVARLVEISEQED
ncbi:MULTISPECIES: glycosyltransferase [unclassified Corynebacterium]|uniref:glycosyltransferase n=1 Tax=unclassified Corynebacterium TaxID=2624378 RepID=UPI0029CA488C|nr:MULTISPECIES: glycosyltransferase [unclassified Corynebacterium]WPF66433.1 glycosyltransferase [Corynebacterium sp. 22KM0430]WPF68923.1 glycosyltransferase [Corynebacterium sp. 21KM1197]